MDSMKTVKTLILDCDGVIVDSEPFSCGAWNVVFYNEYNIDIGTNYDGILGGDSKESAIYFLKKFNLPITDSIIDRLSELKEKVYIELAKDKLKPIKDVETIIQQARSLKWKVAVASSGMPSKIMFSLAQVNLYDKFDVIIGIRKSLRGKPFPDIFLEVAKTLSVSPSNCIVIEDTPKGIAAGKKAGMFVIGITTTFLKEELNKADIIINSFNELNLADLIF